MEPSRVATEYYRTIDTHSYSDLSALLTPDFVHIRPDRTITGQQEFVKFMRKDRPHTTTTHEINETFHGAMGVAVLGKLRLQDDILFNFIDVFTIPDGQITALHTYTNPPP